MGPEGDKRKLRTQILLGLSENFLVQDLLGQIDAFITTDHLDFYDDKNEKSVIRQTLTRISPPNLEATAPRVPSPRWAPGKLVWVEQWPFPKLKLKILKEITGNLLKALVAYRHWETRCYMLC